MRTVITLDSADEACEEFYHEIKLLQQHHEKIVVSLCGGRSIQRFFSNLPKYSGLLSEEEWKKVHFFWTDERLVPPMHEDSNYKLAMDLFLTKLVEKGLLPEENIHRFRGEEDPELETARYTEEIDNMAHCIHIPIMGVGPDCHIGALYPGHKALDEHERKFIFLEDSPKPPARRATLSPRHVIESFAPFLFFLGEEKKEAYEKFIEGGDYREAPCRLASQGDSGKVYVLTDL